MIKKIKITKHGIYIAIFLLLACVVFIYKSYLISHQETFSINQNQKCSDKELQLNLLPNDLKNNKTVLAILRKNCLWVSENSVQRLDVTGDGKPEAIINVSEVNCADCFMRMVIIVDGENLLFQKTGDSLVVSKPDFPIAGFRIKETLRRENESFSSPTEGLVSTYAYDPKMVKEIKDNISSGYHSLGTSNYINNSYFYLYDVRSEKESNLQCLNIPQNQAVTQVKNLPELKTYLAPPLNKVVEGAGLTSDEHAWRVHVYRIIQLSKPVGGVTGMTNTLNWYQVDKCTGKVTCVEFADNSSKLPLCKNN